MKRVICILLLALIASSFLFLWINNGSVSIIDGHYERGSAQIIVDRLPIMNNSKIQWWENNQKRIREKYHIPQTGMDPMLITVYAFGDGYKEEGKEDRRCFDDMSPPRNCLDKNILMTIWRDRDGSIKYDF